jgi:hypothetical protein
VSYTRNAAAEPWIEYPDVVIRTGVEQQKRSALDEIDRLALGFHESALRSYLAANGVWVMSDKLIRREINDIVTSLAGGVTTVAEAEFRCLKAYRSHILQVTVEREVPAGQVTKAAHGELLRRGAGEIEQADTLRIRLKQPCSPRRTTQTNFQALPVPSGPAQAC